jgi:secondary thiamine-phosphate synthase enzyme
LVPIKGKYRHNAKYTGLPGEQNAHAHILSSIIKPYLIVPIINGSLKLGTWQSLFLIELDGPRNREIMVQVFR